MFHTLFYCFFCQLWTCNYQLGYCLTNKSCFGFFPVIDFHLAFSCWLSISYKQKIYQAHYKKYQIKAWNLFIIKIPFVLLLNNIVALVRLGYFGGTYRLGCCQTFLNGFPTVVDMQNLLNFTASENWKSTSCKNNHTDLKSRKIESKIKKIIGASNLKHRLH